MMCLVLQSLLCVFSHREASFSYFRDKLTMTNISTVSTTDHEDLHERHECFFNLLKTFDNIAKNPSHLILQNVNSLIEECLSINVGNTISLLFYLRDRRESLGCRSAFISLMSYVINQLDLYGNIPIKYLPEDRYVDNIRIWKMLFNEIPRFGRWDDLINIAANLYSDKIVNVIMVMIHNQIRNDLSNIQSKYSISFLGKWLPSINASSRDTRSKAKWVIAMLNEIQEHLELLYPEEYKSACQVLPKRFNNENYRKICVTLRNYLNITEHNVTTKKYKSLDYRLMPAGAIKKYEKVFTKCDAQRFKNYKRDTIRYPDRLRNDIDVIKRSSILSFDAINCKIKRKIDHMWEVKSGFYQTNRLVCMCCNKNLLINTFNYRTIDIARTIILRASENNASPYYKNKVLVKTKTGLEFRDLSKCKTVKAKINTIVGYTKFDINEIYKALIIIAGNANSHNVKAEEIPKEFVIVVDDAVEYLLKNEKIFSKKQYDNVVSVFKKYGYTVPKVIIWDLLSDAVKPCEYPDLGITITGGFNLRMAISASIDPQISPYMKLDTILLGDRYFFVRNLFRGTTYHHTLH